MALSCKLGMAASFKILGVLLVLQEGRMEILRWPEKIKGLAIDVDETVYPKSEEYNAHQREAELVAAAKAWGCTVLAAEQRLSAKSRELHEALGRRPSAAEVIRSCEGLSQEWLVEVRKRHWHPEKFLKPHPGLPEKMEGLAELYKIAFASTSPKEVAHRILWAVGFGPIRRRVLVFGGGDCKPKPDPAIYRLSAERMGLDPACCLSIGDRVDFDAYPAMQAGMGAVVIQGIEDFAAVVGRLLEAASRVKRMTA